MKTTIKNNKGKSRNEIATFGAGCFWHVEDAFSHVKGIVKTTVGYMGGTSENPTYEWVCTGKSGHIEVCQVEYDPKKITYEKLLDEFWKIHDPTQLNRQGFDIGWQYRSTIFYHSEEQKKAAIASKDAIQKKLNKRIVTDIVPAKVFYTAEEYHQRYLHKKGLKTC